MCVFDHEFGSKGLLNYVKITKILNTVFLETTLNTNENMSESESYRIFPPCH